VRISRYGPLLVSDLIGLEFIVLGFSFGGEDEFVIWSTIHVHIQGKQSYVFSMCNVQWSMFNMQTTCTMDVTRNL